MKSSFDLSDIKLSQATIEIRYPNAYILWDRAGVIWSKASSTWPNMKMGKAKPMVTSFLIDGRYELSVKLDMAHLIDLNPTSSLKDFITNADSFVTLVANTLDIKEFTRIGFRLIYNKRFKDKAEAATSLIAMKMINVPTGKHFNIEGKPLMPSYSVRWEGESMGARVSLLAQDKKIELDVAPGVEEITPVHIERSEILYDIDYYTLKNTAIGQLNFKEWISEAYHVIKRDSNAFMGA
jgi:hypothetical protein